VPVKTEDQLQRAIDLLNLLLEDQVKLKTFPGKDVKTNIAGVMWGLHWVLERPETVGLDALLRDIEAAKDGPGFNPHTTVAE
jgi:hypothetical protein